jgi:ABC-type branched-subunit amino acid transport system substrate-binding protein
MKGGKMKSKRLVLFSLMLFLSGLLFFYSCAEKPEEAEVVKETIIVGALNDMTGATSDVGKDYALGIAEAIRYVNDQGGINGKLIKLHQFE